MTPPPPETPPPPAGLGRGEALALSAFALSGATSLAYEVLWIRLLGELVGHTAYAVQAVLAVFFGGMALGSALSDRFIRRRVTLLGTYAGLELALAAYGFLFLRLVRLARPAYDALAAPPTAAPSGLGGPLVAAAALLLVPTALMGATFPLVASWWRRGDGGRGMAVPYAVNTAGGALGAWACAFVLIPALGVSRALGTAAFGSAFASALAWSAARAARREPALPGGPRGPTPPVSSLSPDALAGLLFLTGFIAVALEVVWSRALEQVLSGTVYTFATVLTVLLSGIALGSGLHRGFRRRAPPLPLFAALELALAGYTLLSLPLIRLLPRATHALREVLGPGFLTRGVVLETLAGGVLLLVPATVLGLVFPLLLDLAPAGAGRSRLGSLVAANTLGSLCGPLAAGFLLLPRLGIQGSLCVAAWLALSLGVAVWGLSGGRRRPALAIAGIVACAVLTALAPRGAGLFVGPDERLVAYIEDPAATVSVVRDAAGLLLKVNNSLYLGGDVGLLTERRQGHLPMFLHPSPGRVLVLGFGTGATAGAISLHEPERLVAVELVRGVLEAARAHFRASNEAILENPRAKILCADALRFARTSRGPYDLIVGDLFHPWQAGVGSLYSLEHFLAVERLLARGGVFCQWLPLYQLTPAQLRIVVRTFLRVFPEDQAWLGNFGTEMPVLALVGSESPIGFDLDRWRAAVEAPGLGQGLRVARMDALAEALGAYVGGRGGLERFAGTGPINTEDEPLVEFGAPEIWIAGREPSGARPFEDLLELEPDPLVPLREPSGLVGRRSAAGPAARSLIVAQLRLQAGDPAAALAEALRAVRGADRFDAPSEYLGQLGWNLARTRPDLAAEAFAELVRGRPDDATSLVGLGTTSLALRRPAEAATAFQRALALQPRWGVAREGLQEAERQRAAGGPRPPGRPEEGPARP